MSRIRSVVTAGEAGAPARGWARALAPARPLVPARALACALALASTLALALAPIQPARAADARDSAARPGSARVIEGGQARSLRLLSFNVEHHMSASGFEAWRAFCEPLGWQDPIDSRTGRSTRPDALTYCNALDGTDGRGNRVFSAVRSAADQQAKRDALRALVGQARADIVLLQEVSDAEAARDLLGADYTVVSTAELSGLSRLAQNLAIGWRNRLPYAVGEPELIVPLSQAGPDGRRTRPGLAVTVTLPAGQKLALLNIHLKAGCRMGRLDETPTREPARAGRRAADCGVFQQQLPPLEAWVDRKLDQDHGVIVAGDFNRDLMHEIRERMPARNDGSDPMDRPADPRRIASLLAELSDGLPRSAAFTLIRSGSYPKASGCHRGIDQFLVSRNVETYLDKPFREHQVRVLPFAAPVSLDRVRPSDHCPHLLVLGLGQGTERRLGR